MADLTLDSLQAQVDDLKKQLDALRKDTPGDQLSMIVFSGALDKMIAAFIIATGAAAFGTKVTMFFTFWGTAALRNPKKNVKKDDLMSTMFGWMLPKGLNKLTLSQMNMGGMGASMIKGLMRKKNVISLPELLRTAGDLGVKIIICEMSMDLMGMKRSEMVDYPGLDYAGVATFLGEAAKSKTTLFIS
jgi:peroxiredoxin family protein